MLQKLFQVRCDGSHGLCGDQGAIVSNARQARQQRYAAGHRRVVIGRYARPGGVPQVVERLDLCPSHQKAAFRHIEEEIADARYAKLGYVRVG